MLSLGPRFLASLSPFDPVVINDTCRTSNSAVSLRLRGSFPSFCRRTSSATGDKALESGLRNCAVVGGGKSLLKTQSPTFESSRKVVGAPSTCPIHETRSVLPSGPLKDASKLRASFLQAFMSYPYQPLNVPVSHSVKPTRLEDPLGLSLHSDINDDITSVPLNNSLGVIFGSNTNCEWAVQKDRMLVRSRRAAH